MTIKKLLSALFAVALIITSLSVAASKLQVSASAANYNYKLGTYKVDSWNGVNVRYGPSTGYGIAGAAPDDTVFKVSSISGDFGYTDSIYTCGLGYQKGWVNLNYAKIISVEDSGTRDTSSSRTSSDKDYSKYSWIGYLDLDAVNSYAYKYAYSYNPDYGVYGVNGFTYHPTAEDLGKNGKDCVHYIVQLMRTSIPGFKMVLNTGSIRDYVTDELKIEYILYPQISQIEPGDILYTSAGHVTFVQEVDINRNRVLVTAHTNPRYFENMTSRYAVLKTSVLTKTKSVDKSKLRGDINGDGKISITDLTKLNLYLNNKSGSVDLEVYDVTEDGVVDESDKEALSLYINGSLSTMKGYAKSKADIRKASIYTNLFDGTNHYYMDVCGAGTTDEVRVIAYPYYSQNNYNQVFELIPYDGTYYYVKCSYTDMYWNINRSGITGVDGMLQIYHYCDGADNMLFRFERASNGQWYIIDREGFYLYVNAKCEIYADYYNSDKDCGYLTFDLKYVS